MRWSRLGSRLWIAELVAKMKLRLHFPRRFGFRTGRARVTLINRMTQTNQEETFTEEAAKAALLSALEGEDEQEAAAAVGLAVAAAEGELLTREWLRRCLEPVTTFQLTRDEDGETSVALMRRPRAMCNPGVLVRVEVPVDDPAECVDAISNAGMPHVNAFLQDADKRLQYVVFEHS